jgi:hypothetical protein
VKCSFRAQGEGWEEDGVDRGLENTSMTAAISVFFLKSVYKSFSSKLGGPF